MSSLLEGLSSGKIKRAMFILLYGTPKVGKTTFACDAPNPYMIDIEQGSHHLNVKNRFVPKNYLEVIARLKLLAETDHSFKTVIIDSLDHLEPWIWARICQNDGKAKNIEDVGGGYGKGYLFALKEWGEIIFFLKKCRDRGINVICIAHCHTKGVNDPTKDATYDKLELKFNAKASALFKENADAILFACEEVLIKDPKGGKGKAVGTGKHILKTSGKPGHEGGNRYGLPYEMLLDWDSFQAAVDASNPEDPKIIFQRIQAELGDVEDPTILERVTVAMNRDFGDASKLTKILNTLITMKTGREKG